MDYCKNAPKYRKESPWPLLLLVLIAALLVIGRTAIQRDITSLSEYYEDIIDSQAERIEYLERQLEQMQQEIDATTDEPETITAIVTGYAPGDNISGICADDDPSVTSTGRTPGPMYAAADPARLPYGTRLYVPGYGEVEIQDTGGAMRRNSDIQIDLYFDTYRDAIEWGRQELEVVIL